MRYPLARLASSSLLLVSLSFPACSEDTKKSPDASAPAVDTGTETIADAPVVPDVPQETDTPLVTLDSADATVADRGDAGLTAILLPSPATLSFSGNGTQSLTLVNAGDEPLGPLTLALAGENSEDFSFTAKGCESILPGKNCTVALSFTSSPQNLCPRKVTFTATDSNSAGAVTVPLTASVPVPPPLSISPDPYDYGPIRLTAKGPTKKFTLTYNKVPCTGPDSAGPFTVTSSLTDFIVAAETCSAKAVADKGTCTIDVTFQPTTTGMRTGVVRVNGGAIGNAEAALTGSGMPSL